MVQLTAKGKNKYVEASRPEAVAKTQSLVVLAALRNAVNTLVDLSSEPWTQAAIAQAVAARTLLSDIRAEVDQMSLMLDIVEKRVMDL